MVQHFKFIRNALLMCFSVIFIFLICPFGQAFAQVSLVEVSSSPNPVGSGARALGMGGAFIAVADDATAASWNPGGLVQLERPEISVVGEATHRREKNTSERIPEHSGRQSVSGAGLNYLSASYPFTLINRNMVVSLSYQHLYDFSRQWNLRWSDLISHAPTTYDYDANGGLYAYGIAYSVQIIPQLSFGFTLNIWQDGIYHNGWQTTEQLTKVGKDFFGRTYIEDDVSNSRYSFTGFNANLGMLWNITDKLTLGAVFKTPFTANLKHDISYSTQLISLDPLEVLYRGQSTNTYDEKLEMPMSYGIGLAYRFSDRLSVSADVYRTEWQDYVLVDARGRRISPITRRAMWKSDIDPTTQCRLGAEYLFIEPKYTVPVRAGVFYDPAPAKGSPDNYYGFSLGSGIGYGRFIFDIAYVYRFGRDVGKSLGAGKFSQDVDEHSLFTSLIIHF